MNRFIDKLIARHFEPEGNVKPLLGGIFHAAPGETMPLMDEEMADPAVEAGWLPERSSPAIVPEKRGRVSEDVADAGQKELWDRGAGEFIPVDTQLVDNADGAEIPEEPVKPGSIPEKPTAPVERRVKYIERRVKYVEKGKVQDGTREALPDAVAAKSSFLQDATLAKPVQPVLQDLNEGMPVAQAAPGKGRIEGSMPGIINDNNILKGFPTNASPVAPARQSIHVSIGRIEIKAVAPSAETKVAPVKKDTGVMGLDRYLEQRNPAKR